MKIIAFLFGLALLTTDSISQRVYHVSVKGDDHSTGSSQQPLRSISAAAILAQPGDIIMIHAGVYRERVDPPRGGISDTKRITYESAPGEKVIITGAEQIRGWKHVLGDVWVVSISNSFFGSYNPFIDSLQGDWYYSEHKYHPGSVYLDGKWLIETSSKSEILKDTATQALWHTETTAGKILIWAQFKGVDPNHSNVEVDARRTVFYPSKTGINYLTIRGLTLCQAATPWAPPTSEQVGLVGTNWSKGWIIENNSICYSKCSGISLGKYGDARDHQEGTAGQYNKTIEWALANGWNKDHIGGHIVRNNRISHCEQAGIVGSLGCAFSTISGNDIAYIHVLDLFGGYEMAGIKFHGAVDVQITGNRIYHTCRGIWLDWMAQGARVSGNLLYDNKEEDIFFEVNHGPLLIDNNLLLSKRSVFDLSGGTAIVHNLIAGNVVMWQVTDRRTPYFKPHSTDTIGLMNLEGGDDRYYNNIFLVDSRNGAISADHLQWSGNEDYGLHTYNHTTLPVAAAGNVFLHDTTEIQITCLDGHATADFHVDLNKISPDDPVTSTWLGKALVPDCFFETPEGRRIAIDRDVRGESRGTDHVVAGPFELHNNERVVKM